MTEKELKILISKKEQGTLTEKEEVVLSSFEEKMIERNKETIFLNNRHKSIVGRDIYAKINQNKQKRFMNSWMRIAAVLIISISIGGISWYFSLNQEQFDGFKPVAKIIHKKAGYGKKMLVTLPDGSKVKLNSGSEINFPKTFNDSVREVTLLGEAFFDVKKDSSHPFIVKTQLITTRVLGTTFNIKSYEDENDIAITLATGKISVGIQGEDEIILTPSYQVNYNKINKSIVKQRIDLSKFLGWRDGVLRFDNEKLATAITKLEKWFDVKIKLQDKNNADCSFTGVFKNASLENILQNITFVKKGLKYKFISAREVEITGNCNN
ncbi:FecR family protein [Wenyingzhuangia sp. IMCC45467]